MKKNLNAFFPFGNKEETRQWLMRLTVLKMILLISLLTTYGRVNSQMIISHLKLKDVELSEALEKVEELSDYDFVFSYDDVSGYKISVDLESATLAECLNAMLHQLPFEYTTKDDVVIVSYKELVPVIEVQQEKKTITGRVTDKGGTPLPGVSVIIKGTSTGVATDIDGNYTIELESDHSVLIFSFVGMISQEIAYNGQLVQNVILTVDTEQMAEVVVTGYQVISKERAPGSFAILSSEKLETKLQSSLKSSIEGQVAGLVVDKDGNIEIRGVASFRADNSPLIVVDGFPFEGTLESLNSDNIANITVLKDAVSASIYGARSGNGVIVVTTKKGLKGESRMAYKGSIGVQLRPNLSYLNKTNSEDYINAEYELYQKSPGLYALLYNNNYDLSEALYTWVQRDVGEITNAEADMKIERLKQLNGLKQVEEVLLRPKIMQQHNLMISNGSDKNIFNLSINYNSNKNETLHDRHSRLILDVKDEWYFNDKLKINFLSNIYYLKGVSPKSSVFQTISYELSDFLKPYSMLLNPQTGESQNIVAVNPKKIQDYNDKGLKDLYYNPLEEFGAGLIKSEEMRAKVGGSFDMQLTKDLSVNFGCTFTKGFSIEKQRFSRSSFKMRNLFSETSDANDPSIHYIPDGDMIKESRNFFYDYTLRGQLNYKKETSSNNILTVIVGAEKRRNVWDLNNIGARYGYNDISGTFSSINEKNLIENENDTQGWVSFYKSDFGAYKFKDNRYVSFYGNASYDMFEKYILSSSIRVDQSNLFGTDPKYKYTPLWSLGFNYKISNEKFFNVNFVDKLQLRASYGINGNVARDNGPYLIIAPNGFSNMTGGEAYRILSPPNNSLRWERTKSYNFGIDATLCENRFFLTFDHYVKNSDNLLANDEIDPTHGFTSVLKNIGKIQNKGLELNLNFKSIRNENFEWDTNLGLSYNKSKVIKTNIKYNYARSYFNGSVIAKGKPLNALYQYKFAGLDNEGSSLVYNKNGEKIPTKKLTKDDVEYAGTIRPKYVTSLINNLRYKNFGLSFMFIYKGGHKMRKDVFSGSNYTHKDVALRWRKPGDEKITNVPKLARWSSEIWYYPYMDINVVDASYLKLRDVTLTYNLPESIIKKANLSAAKIYCQARNLFKITANNCGIDPETVELNESGSTGAFTLQSARRMPIMSEFYLGLSFNF
jgi:TonB-linked SusC/RagA family outer membrane protein